MNHSWHWPNLVPVTLTDVNDRLVWIDCEMTGLDLARDALIEVAVVVTDSDLNLLDEGLDIVIHAADDVLDTMLPVVEQMHASSGLTDAVRASTITLGEAEKAVLDYVRSHIPEERAAPLCGNSIATDRGFITRDMPLLDAHLHYRMIDVSSLKELARRWYPAGVLRPAGQGSGPPGARRHPREHPGARLLPADAVRRAARPEHRAKLRRPQSEVVDGPLD